MSTSRSAPRRPRGTTATRSRVAEPRAAEARAATAPPPKPGLLAPKGEKALYRLIRDGQFTPGDLDAIAAEHSGYWLAASTLAALRRVADGDTSDVTITQLRQVFDHYTDPAHDPFIAKYLAGASYMRIGIAPGVTAELPFSRDLIALALAELLQERGRLDEAIDVVERATPTAHAAVSLAELYCEAERYNDVIELTDGLENQDDTTALLVTYRGIALTRQAMYDAARDAFKEALKSKKRAHEVRYLALRQRAEAYAAQGKKAQARKDLERILAEDASVEGIRERIQELSS